MLHLNVFEFWRHFNTYGEVTSQFCGYNTISILWATRRTVCS